MDNKITLSVLAQMLSTRTGHSRKECEDMLRSFFQHISASLTAGESVKVKGFGTFKISQVEARMSVDISSGQDFEIPAHNRIVFLPARELATAVNTPFEMFETIELADDVTENELRDNDATAEPMKVDPDAETEHVVMTEDIPQTTAEEKSPETENNVEDVESADEDADGIDDSAAGFVLDATGISEGDDGVEEDVSESASIDSDVDAAYETEPVKSTRRRFRHGFIWGMVAALLLIVVGAGVLYILNEDFSTSVDNMTGWKEKVGWQSRTGSADVPKQEDNLSTPGLIADNVDMVEEEDGMASIIEDGNVVPTRPSDEIVYDTITSTSALGVMARRHYGNYHFWPYIYKENEKILGHPDRIRPGTRVVIPPLSKYGVDPKNPEDIAKAKRMDAEIYSRYKKK